MLVVYKNADSTRNEYLQHNLRPLVEALELDDEGLWMRLSALPSATGRPDEVLLALELDPLALRIHRTKLLSKE